MECEGECKSLLVYVTGIAGAGKTSVNNVLIERGFESYDVDSFGAYYDLRTGERVSHVVDYTERTKKWHGEHEWKTDRARIRELIKRKEESIVFLCGVDPGESEIFGLFDIVIALTVNVETLRERLTSRAFGRSLYELERLESTLKWNEFAEKWYRKHGAIIIDSTQPLEDVVTRILEIYQS